MQTLVIVESPAKAKTIEKYLGENYKVLSSVGHIRDLKTTGVGGLGIDIENKFTPDYKFITGKKKIVNELIKEKKRSTNVLIATDPDREGEAIGWHLAEVLDLEVTDKNRIIFNEITKSGIEKGIKNIRKLDMNLVYSQEGRRIIDRIIGFKLSSLLKKKIKAQSAGRVQSVALRMIVEREEEIRKFIPQEFWTLSAKYQELELDYDKNKNKITKVEIEKIYEEIKNNKKLKVTEIKETNKIIKSPKLFTTSTMQQNAASKINFTSRKTMTIAQKLYEGVNLGKGPEGLITYMRTDSTRISTDVEKTIYAFINKNYGQEYVGYYIQKKVTGAQDAHEAIRPTNINNTPEKIKKYLTSDEFKLYDLIWRQTIAALMSNAKTLTKTYKLKHEKNYLFKTSVTTDVFKGFKIIQQNKEVIKTLDFKENQVIEIDKYLTEQHFTQPKPRYSEPKLIKELEENGVGRPSTYASIIDIIKKRGYVIYEKKSFTPTEEGENVTIKLREYFNSFINVKYTSKLEEELDLVAEGKALKLELLTNFYNFFIPMYEKANSEMPKIEAEQVGRNCPECQEPLVLRKSKYGEFVGCSNFPKCKYNEIEQKEYGTCPKCEQNQIVEKVTKRGKIFYACNGFPKCKYAVWDLAEIANYDPEKEAQKEAKEKKKKISKKNQSKKTTTKK